MESTINRDSSDFPKSDHPPAEVYSNASPQSLQRSQAQKSSNKLSLESTKEKTQSKAPLEGSLNLFINASKSKMAVEETTEQKVSKVSPKASSVATVEKVPMGKTFMVGSDEFMVKPKAGFPTRAAAKNKITLLGSVEDLKCLFRFLFVVFGISVLIASVALCVAVVQLDQLKGALLEQRNELDYQKRELVRQNTSLNEHPVSVRGGVYTRWGSSVCKEGSTLLYSGTI